jgi:hypothetical protein
MDKARKDSIWRSRNILNGIIVSQLSAAQVRRDAAVDWLVVATVPGTDWMRDMMSATASSAVTDIRHPYGGGQDL